MIIVAQCYKIFFHNVINLLKITHTHTKKRQQERKKINGTEGDVSIQGTHGRGGLKVSRAS